MNISYLFFKILSYFIKKGNLTDLLIKPMLSTVLYFHKNEKNPTIPFVEIVC